VRARDKSKMKPYLEEFNTDKSAFQIYRHFCNVPYSFLLDSAMDPGKLGRFSFIGFEPFLRFSSRGRQVYVDCQGWKKSFVGNPFYILKDLLNRYKTDYKNADVPFWGGAVGWFSYDLKEFLEKIPDTAFSDMNIADCELGFYDCVLIFDHLKNKSYIASTGFPETGKKRRLRAMARLNNLKNRLSHLTQYGDETILSHEPGHNIICSGLKSNFTKEEYIRTILKAKDYINQGDIYQINFSQRFSAQTETHAFDIFRVLRDINPAPLGAYLNFGDVQIVSASPERFIRIKGKTIETRPIKGTRPRGRDKTEDEMLRNKLVTSIKDRAENLMIIDLERNDLGRVCRYGSVKVTEFMVCEEFPTVFHLTSTIEGHLRKEIDAVDVLINCFPGGSITGAPKIRAMEIIEELECIKRSIYTGSIGYIGFNGDMDTSIVIRTLIFHKGRLYFSVGGGIVYDSDPEKEYDETLHKAKALLEAIGCGAGTSTYLLGSRSH